MTTSAAAVALRQMARLAARAGSRGARRSTARRGGMRSMRARMSMFAMLEPKRSPTARSVAPSRTAAMSVPSSGSEVAAARRTAPIQSRPILVASAIASAWRASATPASTTTIPLPRNASA